MNRETYWLLLCYCLRPHAFLVYLNERNEKKRTLWLVRAICFVYHTFSMRFWYHFLACIIVIVFKNKPNVIGYCCSPTNLRKGNVFSDVCLSVWGIHVQDLPRHVQTCSLEAGIVGKRTVGIRLKCLLVLTDYRLIQFFN